jgi:NAD-dependent dihydropyrimidine dehydrogenase PreA subunit
MAKILKIKFPDKCIGCELCVYEIQRQLNKIGLDDSPIRVFRSNESNSMLGNTTYVIELDNSVNELDIKKVRDICPTQVFSIENEDEAQELI